MRSFGVLRERTYELTTVAKTAQQPKIHQKKIENGPEGGDLTGAVQKHHLESRILLGESLSVSSHSTVPRVRDTGGRFPNSHQKKKKKKAKFLEKEERRETRGSSPTTDKERTSEILRTHTEDGLESIIDHSRA